MIQHRSVTYHVQQIHSRNLQSSIYNKSMNIIVLIPVVRRLQKYYYCTVIYTIMLLLYHTPLLSLFSGESRWKQYSGCAVYGGTWGKVLKLKACLQAHRPKLRGKLTLCTSADTIIMNGRPRNKQKVSRIEEHRDVRSLITDVRLVSMYG